MVGGVVCLISGLHLFAKYPKPPSELADCLLRSRAYRGSWRHGVAVATATAPALALTVAEGGDSWSCRIPDDFIYHRVLSALRNGLLFTVALDVSNPYQEYPSFEAIGRDTIPSF